MSCRPSVFSHNELVCTIAEDPRDSSQAILKACYEDMKEMIREEEEALKTVANLVRGLRRRVVDMCSVVWCREGEVGGELCVVVGRLFI